jgi:hypothetical protein
MTAFPWLVSGEKDRPFCHAAAEGGILLGNCMYWSRAKPEARGPLPLFGRDFPRGNPGIARDALETNAKLVQPTITCEARLRRAET